LGLVVVLAVGLLWPQTSQAAELTIIRTSLTNGLRVVMNPVPTTSSVVVAMSYLAGSAHDPPTKRGTARLLEAMMFAGNQATGDGEHVKMLTAVGGSASVHRSPELTTFTNLVPAQRAALPLWLEAQRMASLSLPPAALQRERGRLLAVSRSPSRSVSIAQAPLVALALQGYAGYGRPSLADLKAIDVGDLQRFRASYYRIDRAVLSIVGRFDPQTMMQTVRRYFGSLQPTARGAATNDKTPPITAQNSQRYSTLQATRAQRGAVALGWVVPAHGHKDLLALELAGELLAGGTAATLYEALVRSGKALSVETSVNRWRRAGLLQITVGLSRGANAAQTAAEVGLALRALQTRGPSTSALQAAKQRLRLRWLTALQDDGYRAHLLARHELFDGTAAALLARGKAHASISAQQLRKVATRYLANHRRSTVELAAAPIVRRSSKKKSSKKSSKSPTPKRGNDK